LSFTLPGRAIGTAQNSAGSPDLLLVLLKLCREPDLLLGRKPLEGLKLPVQPLHLLAQLDILLLKYRYRYSIVSIAEVVCTVGLLLDFTKSIPPLQKQCCQIAEIIKQLCLCVISYYEEK
jgi:hypothetical protein